MPAARVAKPIVRPAVPTRPATPTAPVEADPPEGIVDDVETDEASITDDSPAVDPEAIFDDGDAVIVPAPAPEVFRAKSKVGVKPKVHYTQTLEFKRTIVPVMLTVGSIALLSALLPMLMPADSLFNALKAQDTYLMLLGGVGVVFLVFAIFNAMQIKQSLAAKEKSAAR